MHRYLVIPLAAYLLSAPLVSALEFRASDQVSIPPTESIREDIYLAGGTVSQLGRVSGDVFAAGGQILSQGDISGDLIATGGSIMVVGTTTDDVRVAGGNVTIHGAVLGDVIVFGGAVAVSGEVRGDVVAFGGTVRVSGPVRGELRAGGGTVTIDAPVGGPVRIDAERVELTSRARLSEGIAYSAVQELSKESGAAIMGAVTFEPRRDVREAAANGLIAFLSLWFVLKFVMLLIGSLLISYFFNGYAINLVERCRAKPLQEFALGLAAMIVIPVVSVVLMAILIGLPLGLLGMLAFFGLGVFAHLIAPIVFGSFLYSWIFGRPPTVNWKTTAVGAIVFYLIWFVPFAGWFARFYFLFLVIGATVSFKWDIARSWQ